MKDAPRLKSPSWPPKIHLLLRHGLSRQGASTLPENNHQSDVDAEAHSEPKAHRSPDMLGSETTSTDYSYQEIGRPARRKWHKSRRIRLLLLGGLIFGTVTIILLSTLLTRHSMGGLGTMFKKTCTIKLPQGEYMGQVLGPSNSLPIPVQVYQGIPYAESTAGKNRLRPAQPLQTKADGGSPYHALTPGPICPQGKPTNKGTSENCLNANIFRPHFGDDAASIAAEERRLGVDSKKLPVVVYVHGGGFGGGSGLDRDLASFVAFADSPVVALSFNYRLGAFGFLPSAVMAKEGLLNLGLKDQQFFFEWARANLPSIGGDPDNVTLMGVSAGAHSIGHHLISYAPANKLIPGPPPFQKAILESGGATARAVFAPDHRLHEQQFQAFLALCGISDVPDDQIVEKLRGLSFDTMETASRAVWDKWYDSLKWAWQPVVDGPGGVIPDLPINSWNKGNVLRIPILTGFNTNEGVVFVPQGEDQPDAVRRLMSSIIPALSKSSLDTLDKLYPSLETARGKELYANSTQSTRFGTEFWRLDDAYGHYAYICPVLQTATLASSTDSSVPVYVFHYAALSSRFGATDHADESPIVAHDMGDIGSYPGLIATADAMNGAFTRFAATGDPSLSRTGHRATYEWPRYQSPFHVGATNETGQIALFGKGNDEQLRSRGTGSRGVPVQSTAWDNDNMRLKAECEFWWSHVLLSEGYGNGTTTVKPTTAAARAML